jgi:hypothetical protein
MIVILGLVILIAAVIVGVAGVLSNVGGGHALSHGFAVFGYHVTGSAGTLRLFRRRSAPWWPAADSPEPLSGQPTVAPVADQESSSPASPHRS